MFKDMTDDQLQAAIETTRSLLYNAVEIRMRNGQVGRLMRDLDIAVAIKRQRQRRGLWTA